MKNVCIQCGADFETTKKPSKFCSPKCRTINYRRDKITTGFKPHCPTCNCDQLTKVEPVEVKTYEEGSQEIAEPQKKVTPTEMDMLRDLLKNPKHAEAAKEAIEDLQDDVEIISDRRRPEDYEQENLQS